MPDTTPTVDPFAGRIAVQVPTAAEALDISRTTIYKLIQTGEIASVKVGSRRLIPVESIRTYLASLSAA